MFFFVFATSHGDYEDSAHNSPTVIEQQQLLFLHPNHPKSV
jgi:hypothetical protein